MPHPHDLPADAERKEDLLHEIADQPAQGFGEAEEEFEPLFEHEGPAEHSALDDVMIQARESAQRLDRQMEDKRRAAAIKRLAQTDRATLRTLRESGQLDTMSVGDIERYNLERGVEKGFERDQRNEAAQRRRRASEFGMEDQLDLNRARHERWVRGKQTWDELARVSRLLEGEKIGPWYKPWANKIKFIGRLPEEFDGTTVGLEMKNVDQAREWFEKKGDSEGVALVDQYETLIGAYREMIQDYDAVGLQREGLAESRRATQQERPPARVEYGSKTPFEQPKDAYEGERNAFAHILDEQKILLDPDHRRALLDDDWLVVNVAVRGGDLMKVAGEQKTDLEAYLMEQGVTVDLEGNANQRQLTRAMQLNPDARLDHAARVLPALHDLINQKIGSPVDRLPRQVASAEPFEDVVARERERLEAGAGVERIEGGARGAEVDMEYMREVMERGGDVQQESAERMDYLKDVPMDEDYKAALSNDSQFRELAERFDGDVRAAAHEYRELVAEEVRQDGIVVGDDYMFDIRRARRVMSKPVADYYALLLNGANELIQTLTQASVPRDALRSRFDARDVGRLRGQRDKSGLEKPAEPFVEEIEQSESETVEAIDKLDAFLKAYDIGDDASIYLYDNRFIEALEGAGGLWDASTVALRELENDMKTLGLLFKSDGSVDGRTLRRVKREKEDKAGVIDEDVRFHSALLALRDKLIEERMY